MAKVTGGRLAVRALKQEGVTCIFALSGGHIDPLFQACLDEGMKLIDVRHEQAAAFMADGWARVTGTPGVAVVTAGPGVTNAVTGIWNAYECLSPIVVFGGKSPLFEFDLGSLQELNSLSLVESVTKWQRAGYETRRIPEYVGTAFRHAASGRPGPAYLEFPADLLYAEIEEAQVAACTDYRSVSRPEGDAGQIEKAMELLVGARRPIAIAGSGVFWSQAGDELRELVELLRLPLTLIQMGRGTVPEDHPLCFGPTRVGTKRADVVLLIGTRLNYGLNFGRPGLFSMDQTWIQIDIEPTELGRNRPIDIGIAGDAKAVLRRMVEAARERCKGRTESPWIEECRAYVKGRQEQLEADMSSDSVPVHPARLCREIRDYLDRDATIVMDGGNTTIWGAAVLKSYLPGHWLDNGPTGCLGVGVPFAMAAKVARPDKQVVLLNGDGSFGLNGMEFDTMVRHGIPVVCVVCNDEAWGMMMHPQQAMGEDRVVGTRLGFRPYDRMVQGLGGYGEAVERPEDIRPALARAFASGLPACINVRCLSLARGAQRRM